VRGGGGQRSKVFLGKVNELLVRNATSADEDHAVSGVVVLDVVGELGAGNIADILSGSKNSTTQRLVLVCRRMEVVKDDFVQLLLDLLRLAKDDVALALDGGGLELRVLEDVRKDINSLGYISIERSRKVDGVLALH
jgi:hypothetical protein